MTKTKELNKILTSEIWGGRFDSKTSEIMQQINASISFDWQLYRQDIQASVAHATMLGEVGIIKKDEVRKIISGLEQIEQEISTGKFVFKQDLEDIHMNIEGRLSEIIGDVAGKLHTSRSRNDQVATDLKLFIRDAIDEIDLLLKNLQLSIISKAKDNIETIMPGFTHLQTAQPVSFAHHLMAYFEMIKRDRSRLKDTRKRLNSCPLGSCALAGTSFPIDRSLTAKLLAFDSATDNSMDSVSDRDFAAEFLFDVALIATHLSRLAEEIIIWMSKGFGFIVLSDAFTSGSSIMPQKKNPDAAELVRGKTGRIFGSLLTLLTVLKGLPLTYAKDMQEDKEPVFDANLNIRVSITAIRGMIDDMSIKKDKMLAMAGSDFSTATDLADWLVVNLDMPFRKAHHLTGKIVRLAEKTKRTLIELSLDEMRAIEPRINQKIYEVLSVESSVKSRVSFGGTSQLMVKKAIIKAEKEIGN